jgi:hypothetical protein
LIDTLRNIIRFIGTVIPDQNDDWQSQHRHMIVEALSLVTPRTVAGSTVPWVPESH